jgi:hypothetical protein
MAFDINETLANMLKGTKGVIKDNWPMVKETANEFLQNRKERLALLAELRLNGDIDNATMKEYLGDEKKIFESELHAIAIITKAMAQKAANTAIDIFEKAVKTAIGLN